jgi:hypothetical protein
MRLLSRKTAETFVVAVGFVVVSAAGLSLVHPWGNLRNNSSSPSAILGSEPVPGEVRSLLEHKCGDCHSNNTRWPLYSRVAPASWLIEHDVAQGREHLNFSSWERYSTDTRVDLLSKVVSQLRQEKMPLKGYIVLHPGARLSPAERKLIMDWSKVERRRLLTASK